MEWREIGDSEWHYPCVDSGRAASVMVYGFSAEAYISAPIITNYSLLIIKNRRFRAGYYKFAINCHGCTHIRLFPADFWDFFR